MSSKTLAALPTSTEFRDAPNPPGPQGLPIVGVLHKLVRDPWEYLPHLAEQYGDIFAIPTPMGRVLVLSHPDNARDFFNRTDLYNRTNEDLRTAMTAPGKKTLPIRDGEDHKQMRRLLNPQFSPASLRDVGELIAQAVEEDVAGWEHYADSGQRFEMQLELGIMTMSALQRSMFSRRPPRAELERLAKCAYVHGHHMLRAMITFGALKRLPKGRTIYRYAPWLAKGRANVDLFIETLADQVAERHANPTDNDDLLNTFLRLRIDGRAFTDEELPWELGGFMFAGFETTAAALAWTIQLLVRHPRELAEARREVDALPEGSILADQVDQLPYLRACFDEGQRIQANPMNFRWAKEDHLVGGYRVPKDTPVIVPMYALHHDPRFWTAPKEFRPSRFQTESINRHAFIPFGAGPRKCIGMRMAYLEGVLALANILRRYELDLPADWEPKREFHLSVGLADLPIRLRRR